MVAVRITSALAVLLAGGGGSHRSLFSTCDGRCHVQKLADITIDSALSQTAMDNAGAHPKYIICDKGQQFWCGVFKDWCDGHGITPRFGTVGQHGNIALIERFIQTLKNEGMRIILVPLRTDAFHQ